MDDCHCPVRIDGKVVRSANSTQQGRPGRALQIIDKHTSVDAFKRTDDSGVSCPSDSEH